MNILELLNTPIAEKVPALLLMVIVVIFFLRHLKVRDEGARELHRESNAVILENTKILGGVGEIIRKTNGH